MARHVVDYLVEEVLLRQAEEVQDFLMQSCVLARLNGDHERWVPLAQQALELMSEEGGVPHIPLVPAKIRAAAVHTPNFFHNKMQCRGDERDVPLGKTGWS